MALSCRGPMVTAIAAVSVLSLMLAGCANAKTQVSGGGNGAPGVTSDQIDVGSIANVTGPLSSDFAPVVNGVQAYFDMINAQGGVAGRKLNLAYQTDDQGSSTTDLTDAQELVEQDHVFAVVGVGTPFFGGAAYLAHEGVPTFGYQVSSDWEDGPTLFASYGSVLDYTTSQPEYAYVARQLHAQSVGVVAYGVPQSAAACHAVVAAMQAFGLNVSYQDLSFSFGSDPTVDVLQLEAHHVDLLFTCLDVTGNIAFARAIQQNGLSMHQVWLSGYDRSTLQQYGSLMNGVYFMLDHVPFEAATAFPGKYPGIEQYIRAMQRYEPSFTYDEVALAGWVSADQFVTGLKEVGRNLTQAKLVAAINRETAFTADGLTTPINWTVSHTQALPPYCATYVVTENDKFVPTFVQPNNEVFVCFNSKDSDVLTAPPAGTPGT